MTLVFRSRQYLPKAGVDLNKWQSSPVTSSPPEPEYWHDGSVVGDAPSTLNLTFPEVHLEKPGAEERIQNIQLTMQKIYE
ncbi:MAG: hypothetical protein U0Z26_18975 [Anaerolineales bacterium]